MRSGAVRQIYDVLLVIFFIVAVTTPLLSGIFLKDKKRSLAEKRTLVEFPERPRSLSGVPTYLQGFEEYYNDHFGLREQMIFRYHREMETRFGIAGSPLVLKGEDKWLFYNGNDLLKDYRGELQLSAKQLEKWHQVQRGRQQWLEERGIAYLTFAPPNKQSIYPEYMPEKFRKSGGTTRMSQLHNFLDDNPTHFFINLEEELKFSKTHNKLYYSMDTHWNDYGSYMAFRKVMEKIQQLFPDYSYSLDFPFRKEHRRIKGGDLAGMLMIDKDTFELVPTVKARHNCSKVQPLEFKISDNNIPQYKQSLYKTCTEATLKAVVFGDSFIDRFEPFFSENFAEIIYIYKPFDKDNILEVLDRFKPDLVIEERVERNYFRHFDENGWQ